MSKTFVMKTKQIGSVQVLDALRAGPLREPAHIWLYNVRNATGVVSKERYADAIAVSVWPSRGLWIAGIEVKVARNDWQRELDQPKKSAEIQQFCDYWWIAAPEGVVKTEELPKTWGLYEVSGKKCRVARNAPKLKPKPLTMQFVASVLRNNSDSVQALVRSAKYEAQENAAKDHGADKLHELNNQLIEVQRQLDRAEMDRDSRKRDAEQIQASIKEFERAAGLEHSGIANYRGGGYGPRHIGECFRLAQILAQLNPERLAEQLRSAATELDGLSQLAPKPEAAQ